MKRQVKIGDFKIGDAEKKAINAVLDDGKISEGDRVKEFEESFGEYIGTKYAIALSSGTSALIAGITAMKYSKSMKIHPKTNVITTPITYVATSNAIKITGFNPIYVDVDPHTFLITPENIKNHLENADNLDNYSLILPVHLMGYPCDMNKINKIAKSYGLQVFEDSSQAHGTTYDGKKTGSLASLSSFSFYIAHNIQAGEMGAITTDNYDIIKLVRKIKANGRMCECDICKRMEGKCPKLISYVGDEDFDPRFTHEFIGYNFKTMEFQAALAITQLQHADQITKKRFENVKYLNESLEQFSDSLKLPDLYSNVSYMAYPIVLRDSKFSRKKIRNELETNGIETRPLFGCIPTQQPAYNHLRDKYLGQLPIAENLGKNAFYIGCHQYLNQEDLDYIISVFKNVFN